MKTCSKCKTLKSESEFFRDRRRASGLHSECKECTKAAKQKWAERNVEHTRAYSRVYYYDNLEERKAKHREFLATPSAKKRNREAKKLKRSSEEFRLKDHARNLVEVAVRNGSLVRKPCQVCGSMKAEGHHTDYSKPLEVQWLCKIHHAREHRRYVQAA